MTDGGTPAIGPAGQARRWTGRLLLVLPVLLLGVPAASKFIAGLRIDAAFPVPVYVQMNVRLPKASYEKGITLLTGVRDGGGELMLTAAEAASDVHAPASEVAALSREGLSRMPGSARGWLVLSASLRKSDPARSARALAMSYQLSPFDYWIAGWRAQAAAEAWDRLDAATRKTALWQTKLLWSESWLRPQFAQLLRTASGRALVKRAFRSSPDDIVAINRWYRWWTRRAGQH